MKTDLHMHTTYCDGNNTPEEMIESAIRRGLDVAGISGHSYMKEDDSYCMSLEGTEQYIAEISELKKKYEDRITVLLGIERDYLSDIDNSRFEYVIGSVHCVGKDGICIPVDWNADVLKQFADRFCGGDMMTVAEMYYENVGGIVERSDCDIIGHFDLITKFIEQEAYPDTNDPRYIAAWKRAVDRIFEAWDRRERGKRANDFCLHEFLGLSDVPIFEINTGAISRGYRTTPYPMPDQVEYIRTKGGVFITNSDSHKA